MPKTTEPKPAEAEPTPEEQREAEESARAARALAEAEANRGLPADATIHQRMAAILAELPAIGKTSENTQQKFMYRSHDAVLNALNPLMARHGVTVVPHAILERITDQRATRSGGVMYEVNLHSQYRFYGLSGDYVEAEAWGEGTDSGDKATNKAMTMAFKNVLAQAFAVSTEDTVDSDSTTDEETTGRASLRPQADEATLPKPPPNWSEALKRFDSKVGTPGEGSVWLEELVEKCWGASSLNDLTGGPEGGRIQALRAFSTALLHLEAEEGELALLPGLRERIAQAFAKATLPDGSRPALVGPPWRLGPDEETLPSRDEYMASRAEEAEPEPEPQSS